MVAGRVVLLPAPIEWLRQTLQFESRAMAALLKSSTAWSTGASHSWAPDG